MIVVINQFNSERYILIQKKINNKFLFYLDAAFIAYIQGTTAIAPFKFDATLLNTGGHFDVGRAEYTTPYNGLYQFSCYMQGDDQTAGLEFSYK